MRILGIVGSPRTGGSTDILVEEVLEGARESGHETVKVAVGPDLEGCRGCMQCEELGHCPVPDGMQAVYPELAVAGALVIGLPIYFGHLPGQLKSFFDRWRCLISFKEALQDGGVAPLKPRLRLRGKRKALLLLTYYQPGRDRFAPAATWLTAMLKQFGIEVTAELRVDKLAGPLGPEVSPEQRLEAREAGRREFGLPPEESPPE